MFREMKNQLCKDCADTEEAVQRYAQTVYRLAFARSGTRFDADEIFQEVFLRYTQRHPSFNSEEHRKAWLIRVTVNCSKTLINSPWRRHTCPLDEELPFEAKELTDLYNELQRLPPKYREVIHLFYYEGLSLEEISAVLKRKNSTVRSQLTRAREMLRKWMKEEDYV